MFLDADFGTKEGPSDWKKIMDRTGLSKPTIYRDVKAMRDARILLRLGPDHYLMPVDDPSMTVDSLSTTVDSLSTTVERTVLTELSESFQSVRDPMEGFSDFWNIYPKRNGKRLGRKITETKWAKLTPDEQALAMIGATHYAAAVASGVTIAKDPERFLRHQCWEDWQEPAEVPLARQAADRAARSAAIAAEFAYRDEEQE
jgi:hypothetical protein